MKPSSLPQKLDKPALGPNYRLTMELELTEAHRKLAAELGVVIVASGFEKRATGLYHNTA